MAAFGAGGASFRGRWGPVAKAAVTSGSLMACGDALAQALQRRGVRFDTADARRAAPPAGPAPAAAPAAGPGGEGAGAVDLARVGRLFTFGLGLYGPAQHYWYAYLARTFPVAAGTRAFLSKVALNQLALGPVVTSCLFAWNLALQGRRDEVPGKIRTDLLPTLVKGWSFWVPASSVNFYAVPLQHQVLYMSSCGLVWGTILSLASS